VASLRDSGLLLRRFAFGESSLVCHALTREHGRVHLLAKGAYRPTSRFYAALDLFDTLELAWSQAVGRELQVLQAASVEVRRRRIAEDLERYQAALTVLELAGIGAPESGPAPGIHALASAALDALDALVPPAAAVVEFELAFLQDLGLAPALSACASCGGPAPPLDPLERLGARAAFSAGAGGRLCAACAVQARAAGRRVGTLPVEVLERADAILARRVPAAAIDPAALTAVRDAVARFLEYHLEGRPKSYRAFLAEPNRNRPSA
jgi:DNA repair protein RecO